MSLRLLGVPLALAALIAAAGVAFLSFRETNRNTEARRHLLQRLSMVQQVVRGLTDAETGQRGYFLTGDARDLEPYAGGVESTRTALAFLQEDGELWASLRTPVEQKLAELDRTLQLFRSGRQAQALALLRTNEGRRWMEEVRATCQPAIRRAEEERARLNLRLQTLARRTFLAVAVALALGLAALFFGATERRKFLRAQRILSWQEARYRNLADHAPAGIFELDRQGNTLYRNAAQQALFGFSEHDSQRNPWRPLVHPEDLPHVLDSLERGLRDVLPFDDEYRICRPGEPHRWVRVQGRPSFGPDGEHIGFLGTLVDIHFEKAQMLAAQESQEAQHRAFFELAAAGLARADLGEGRLLAVNEAFGRMLGYEASELVGMSLLDLAHPEDRPTHEAALRETLQEAHGSTRFEQRYLRRDGSTVWVDLSFALLRRAGERSTEVAAIAVDITARKEAEAALKGLNADLETRVERRTAELKEANRELEAFSYSVSHDLRAPLRHLDGFTGLLERHLPADADDKAKHYLHRIGEAARTMGVLIDDLLAFSRMSRQELRTGPVDLDALLKSLSAEYADPVSWSLPPLGRVQGDASMLRQAFRNLVSNAVKFSRNQSPPTVEVRMEGLRNGRRIYCVQDNGVGFDMAYRDKLFGVFQRLHPESEFEGTGIGLAIVARVVRRHGGEVWAESALGQGARFYLSLPPYEGEAA